MKKFLIPFLLLLLTLLSLTACNQAGNNGNETEIVSITKTSTNGPVDTYTVLLADGTSISFEVLSGTDDKSVYELYCITYGYTGSESKWLRALAKGKLPTVINYTVTFEPGTGGEAYTQMVRLGEKTASPEPPKRLGYTFLGWYYTNEEITEKWNFSENVITEDITLTAKWDYATYELPIVNIDTAGTVNSKIEYTDMIFSIENCDGELNGISGGIRLRGNTTMKLPKKPYRIKFDKKQSLFGLDKAKSWVLLADYLDPSALHNYTAFNLASEMDGLSFTPTPHKVNVYMNGEYAGLYTLCEQVQENEGRMDIELDEITEDMVDLKQFNFFIAMDHSVRLDTDAIPNETYFYIEEYDRYFEVKYPEKEQFTSEEQFRSFMEQLKAYIVEMWEAFESYDLEKIKAEANVDSLIDFLIIDFIMGENDHTNNSFNMYYTNTSNDPRENGKLNFGPIWDYDLALNTHYTGTPNENFEYNPRINYSNVYFKAVAGIPELFELLKDRYNNHAVYVLEEYMAEIDTIVSAMDESLNLNQELWYSEIRDDLTYKNIVFLKDFLRQRKSQLDKLWA